MTAAARLALEALDTIDLKEGSHAKRSAGVCAMEAVAWMAGEKHTDHPVCASPMIASFLRSWNDQLPDDAARNRLIRPLLPLVLDTVGSDALESQRSLLVYDWLVRVFTPAWLDLHPELTEHATALRALVPLRDEASARAAQTACKAAGAAADAQWSVAWSAARSAARSAAESAARSAAESVARSAARSAAWSAAWSAARSAAWSAAWSAARSAARSAAWSAAWSAITPTVEKLQLSAQQLVRDLCAMKDAA